MNEDYREAFVARAKQEYCLKEAEQNLKYFIDTDDSCGILTDRDGSCRSRFGLAAWLSSTKEQLPPLKNGGSWFFPLKAPVHENHLRTRITESLNIGSKSPSFDRTQSGKPNYLEVKETPFAYRPTNIALPGAPQGTSCNFLWAAVDCSIPVDGQISVLHDLAKRNREHLRGFGYLTHDRLDAPILFDVEKSEIFGHMRFLTSKGHVNESDIGKVWFAICIDTLGPIESQIEGLLRLLKNRHQQLIDSLTVTPFFKKRFSTSLPSIEQTTGGSRLKALYMIAELFSWGHDQRHIAEILGVTRKPSGYAQPWHQQFDESIQEYIDESQNMINDGYKWLIYAGTS